MLVAKICAYRLWIPFSLTLTLFLTTVCHASPLTIEQLMQTLAKAKPSHAAFIEKKQIALLDQPVESSGELFFTAPDHLEKRTLHPHPESLIVDGDKIIIERGRKTYYFTMQNLPELGIFISSIRGTLAGDLNALKRSFQLNLEGDANQWTLQLTPTQVKMKKLLQHIRIAGLTNQVQSIEIFQTDGDSAHMTIQPLDQKP
jgi:outer membrane lipoprotein-sorting protein